MLVVTTLILEPRIRRSLMPMCEMAGSKWFSGFQSRLNIVIKIIRRTTLETFTDSFRSN